MSDNPLATALAATQKDHMASKPIIESDSSSKLRSSQFDDGDIRFIMTTDGGNDTEPENEAQEDIDEDSKKTNKTSPKKRAAANAEEEEEEASPKKKRTPAKSKAATKTPERASKQTLEATKVVLSQLTRRVSKMK
ncbi:MAG: hypothetical protein Q9168_002720 [Polycauliona sp. 1 TL-2023]